MDKARSFRQQLVEMIPIDLSVFRHIGSEPIPMHLNRWWFALGGSVLYLFLIQLFTGILLTFYYVPTPSGAYESVELITQEIRFGWFIRSLHKWASNFMIVALILHVLRVFFTGSYRHPRQLNWMVGFCLLLLTLTFGFTGYSLVYEQLSFWGATVATNLVGAIPWVGESLAHLLRGGPEITGNTLTRFYVIHIGLLPTLMFIFLAIHLVFIRIHGVMEIPVESAGTSDSNRFFKFWPDHVTTEMMVGLFLIYILTLLAVVFPAGLGEPADPNLTPEHIKPEWYFYFSYRLLKLTSLETSVLITAVMGMIAFSWPFIEQGLKRWFPMTERVSIVLGILAFFVFLLLTVWEASA